MLKMCSTRLLYLAVLFVAFLPLVGLIHGQLLSSVTLRGVDDSGALINYPMAFTISPYGPVTTQSTGLITIQLSNGNYDVAAYLFGILVGTTSFQVSGTLDQPIVCHVYPLIVNLQNSDIQTWYAKATIYNATSQPPSEDTQNGLSAIFPQLPEGAVRITIYNSVSSEPIAIASINMTRNNNVISLHPGVLFDLTATVFDVAHNPVPNAYVIVGADKNYTGPDGAVTFFEEEGQTNIIVTYEGVEVLTGLFALQPSQPLQLNATVYPLRVLIIDESGSALTNQRLNLTLGFKGSKPLSQIIPTDNRGYLNVSQLPPGQATLQFSRSTIPLTFTFPLPLQNNTLTVFAHPLTVQVYPQSAYMLGFFDIIVTGKIGDAPLNDAVVIAGGTTTKMPASGRLDLRVPLGLNPVPSVNVTVVAYGQKTSKIVSLPASPVIVIMFPISFLPVVGWRFLVRRYKRNRVPLA